MDKSLNLFLHQSRLVRKLGNINTTDIEATIECFSERFGQLMDFSGAILLAATLEELPAISFNPTEISPDAIKDDVIKERAVIIRNLVAGFIPGIGYAGKKLPTPAEYHVYCKMTGAFAVSGSKSDIDHTAAYEPFRKYYVKRQGEIALRVRRLQSRISKSVAGLSPELAQLSMLDSGVGDVLAVWSGKVFAKIPRLLGKRFSQQIDAHWQAPPDHPCMLDIEKWLKPDGWIGRFCVEMREVLLAELDIRMQPILCMIDALPKTQLIK